MRALDLFSRIYAETDNFAAGYNAAVLTKILGDLAAAIDLMDALYSSSGNPKAAKEKERMLRTLADE